MKLVQYNHFDIVNKTIAIGEDSLVPYIVLDNADAVPNNYTDVTLDIEAIDRVREFHRIDYLTSTILQMTACPTQIAIVGGFNNLNDKQKKICAKHHCIDDFTLVAYLMATYGLSQVDAEEKAIETYTVHGTSNAEACNSRFLNKGDWDGWWKILLQSFDGSEALKIIDAVGNYMIKYREYALFGIGYGDTEFGLINFIMNDGGIVVSIENFTLKIGVIDYAQVKNDLLKFYWIS